MFSWFLQKTGLCSTPVDERKVRIALPSPSPTRNEIPDDHQQHHSAEQQTCIPFNYPPLEEDLLDEERDCDNLSSVSEDTVGLLHVGREDDLESEPASASKGGLRRGFASMECESALDNKRDASTGWAKIPHHDGLSKMLVDEGHDSSPGLPPSHSATVTFCYKVSTNPEFVMPDIYHMDKPITAKLSDSGYPLAVILGLQTMHTGETSNFRVDRPTYGYGVRVDKGSDFRSADVLYFQLKLLGFFETDLAAAYLKTDPTVIYRDWTYEDQLRAARQFCEQAQACFAARKYEDAAILYKKGAGIWKYLCELGVQDFDQLTERSCSNLKLAQGEALLGLAQSYAAMDDWNEVAEPARGALTCKDSPTIVVEAALLLAQFSFWKGKIQDAQRAIMVGLFTVPGDPKLLKQKTFYAEAYAKASATEKLMCQRMFAPTSTPNWDEDDIFPTTRSGKPLRPLDTPARVSTIEVPGQSLRRTFVKT